MHSKFQASAGGGNLDSSATAVVADTNGIVGFKSEAANLDDIDKKYRERYNSYCINYKTAVPTVYSKLYKDNLL